MYNKVYLKKVIDENQIEELKNNFTIIQDIKINNNNTYISLNCFFTCNEFHVFAESLNDILDINVNIYYESKCGSIRYKYLKKITKL